MEDNLSKNPVLRQLQMELIHEVVRVMSELRPVSAIVVNDYTLKNVIKDFVGDLPGDMNDTVGKAKILINYNQKESFAVASEY